MLIPTRTSRGLLQCNCAMTKQVVCCVRFACLTRGYEAVGVSRAAQHLHVPMLAVALTCTARMRGSCTAAAAADNCVLTNTICQPACCKLYARQQHRLIGSKQSPAACCAQQLRLQLLWLPTLQVCCTAPRR
jgi:hypothetical protein